MIESLSVGSTSLQTEGCEVVTFKIGTPAPRVVGGGGPHGPRAGG